MLILVDTREQQAFSFRGPAYAEVSTDGAALAVGDYSLGGLADRVAVERKSLDDLVHCLSQERERFERELARAMGLDAFCVVVEDDWQALAEGRYRSRMQPHAACQSIAAFTARYGTPFFFAGSRKGAEYVCFSFLRQYLASARARWRAICKAHGEGMISGKLA